MKSIILMSSVFAFLLSVATVVQAKGDSYQVEGSVNMRDGPDSSFALVGVTPPAGTTAEGLEHKGNWRKVHLDDGIIGWLPDTLVYRVAPHTIAADHKKVQSNDVLSSAVTKQMPVEPVTIPSVSVVHGYRVTQTSHLRNGPGPSFKILGYAGKGAVVRKIEQNGDWFKIQLVVSRRIGWVYGRQLEKQKKAIEPPKMHTMHIERVPAIMDSDPSASVEQDYRVIQTSHVRSGPSPLFKILGYAKKGTVVHGTEQNGDWFKVQLATNGRIGWVYGRQLAKQTVDSAVQPVIRKATVSIPVKKAIEPLKMHTMHIERVPAIMDSDQQHVFHFSHSALMQAQNPVVIETYNIKMDESDVEALFSKKTYNRSSFPVVVHLQDGSKLQGKIAVLGSSTLSLSKKSLTIKLADNGRIHGHKRLAFRAMASDGSMIREWISWKLMKAMGLAVPDVHFAWLNINGKHSGLFLNIEWLDKTFMKNNGLALNGEFYQPVDEEDCGDLSVASLEHLGVCWNKLAPHDDDYSALRKLVQSLGHADVKAFHNFLEAHFTDATVTNWLAVNTLVSDSDSYKKNYFLHHDADTGKWTVIPWDYNMVFGRNWDPVYPYPRSLFNGNFQYYYNPDAGPPAPLKNKALQNTESKAALYTQLKHLLGLEMAGPENTFGWFSPTVMRVRIAHLLENLKKLHAKDTWVSLTPTRFQKENDAVMHYVIARVNYLKTMLFGAFVWQPIISPVSIDPVPLIPQTMLAYKKISNQSNDTILVDPVYALFLAKFIFDQSIENDDVDVQVKVEGAQAPHYLPAGFHAGQCVQRSWIVSTSTPYVDFVGDITFEYLQENSIRNELGKKTQEKWLELWMFNGVEWRPVATRGNYLSNTLTAMHIRLHSGAVRRFIACSPS